MSHSLTPAGPSCPSAETGYSVTGVVSWCSWITRSIDLSSLQGSCVTIKITAGDNYSGNNHGQIFFDAVTAAQKTGVSYCQGSGQAIVQASEGYALYQWLPPQNSNTLSSISLSGVSGTTSVSYTAFGYSGCNNTKTFTVAPTTVSLSAININSSCLNGSSGSATVHATGSSIGYNYTWLNSTNSVVSTSPVMSNQPPGVYSYSIWTNSSSCGSTSSTISIGSQTTAPTYFPKPFCSSQAYMYAPPGSNYQWFLGQSPIPGPGGTTPSLTVSNPGNNSKMTLTLTTNLGCKDSIIYTLISTVSQPVNIALSPLCFNSTTTGTVNLILNQAPGHNSIFVTSIGNTPTFTFSAFQSSISAFSLSNLSSGTYSVSGFDGSCQYTKTFSVIPVNQDFTISPSSSRTICAGATQSLGAILIGTSSVGYSYSWQPQLFNLGSTSNSILALSNTLAASTQSLVTYTVNLYAISNSCVLSKTIIVLFNNPGLPTITPIPQVCNSDKSYSVSVIPPAGSISGSGTIISNQTISPTNLTPGIHTYTVGASTAGCLSGNSATFTVLPGPTVTVAGDNGFCIGITTTLNVLGANSYSWSNGLTAPTITLAPIKPFTLTVSGYGLNGCVDTVTLKGNPILQPTIHITGNTTVCDGDRVTLIASGAANYNWSVGSANPVLTFTPNTSKLLLVTGSNSQKCIHTLTVPITVNKNPAISVLVPTLVCAHHVLSLKASGASSYFWNNSSTSNPFTITPISDVSYTVVGTDSSGCVSKKIVPIEVLRSPALFNLGDGLICSGESTTLTIYGADSYLWTHNNSTLTTQLFQPTTSTVYTVTGTFTTGCSTSLAISLIVLKCVGVEENDNQTSVQVFPNPVTNKLIITSKEEIKIEIFDNQGRLVLTQKITETNNEVDLTIYAKGVYYVSAYDHEGNTILKVKILKAE